MKRLENHPKLKTCLFIKCNNPDMTSSDILFINDDYCFEMISKDPNVTLPKQVKMNLKSVKESKKKRFAHFFDSSKDSLVSQKDKKGTISVSAGGSRSLLQTPTFMAPNPSLIVSDFLQSFLRPCLDAQENEMDSLVPVSDSNLDREFMELDDSVPNHQNHQEYLEKEWILDLNFDSLQSYFEKQIK